MAKDEKEEKAEKPSKPNLDDGLDMKELDKLTLGPKGYHREKGFEIVTNDPSAPGGIVPIPLFAVLCKSQRHPTPQLRFLSSFELERGVIEVSDRVFGIRIPDPTSARSLLVVGRLDDAAEVAKQYGKSKALGFVGKLFGKLFGGGLGLLTKVGSIIAKVTDKITKA